MNELINVNDIKNGMTVFYNGNICQIQSFLHVKPGKGAAIMKVKMRNLKTGTITEESINSNVKIEKAHVDKKKMVYLYNSGSSYVFMDNETYEQIEITPDKISTAEKYLKEKRKSNDHNHTAGSGDLFPGRRNHRSEGNNTRRQTGHRFQGSGNRRPAVHKDIQHAPGAGQSSPCCKRSTETPRKAQRDRKRARKDAGREP